MLDVTGASLSATWTGGENCEVSGFPSGDAVVADTEIGFSVGTPAMAVADIHGNWIFEATDPKGQTFVFIAAPGALP